MLETPEGFLCWKVVQIDPHAEYTRFVSCIVDDPMYQVEYKINHWVEPKYTYNGYGLLAFGNFPDARKFCDRIVDRAVFKCLGMERMVVKKFPRRAVLYSGIDPDRGGLFISLGHDSDGSWPRGTVMFRQIKLLERVWG